MKHCPLGRLSRRLVTQRFTMPRISKLKKKDQFSFYGVKHFEFQYPGHFIYLTHQIPVQIYVHELEL